MKKVILLLVVLVGLAVLAGGGLVVMMVMRAGSMPKSVEQVAFNVADEQIKSYGGAVAFGNSEEARKLAEGYAETMQDVTAKAFTGGKADSKNRAKNLILVYCHLTEEGCVFLVNVPQLKRYKDDVREMLAAFSWVAASEEVKGAGLGKGVVKLGVGLRGDLLYGPIMVGEVGADEPVTKATGEGKKDLLYPLFRAGAGALPGGGGGAGR